VSIVHLAAFVFWEAKIARSAILPFDIWQAKSFGLLLLLVFFSYMSLGIWLWYFALFSINIRGYTLIETGANYAPLAIGGTMAAFLAAWLVSRVPAQYILATGNLALVAISVLLATTPRHQTYWAMMFPSALLASFTVDLIFASSQIIASAAVGRKRQGVAGSLISTLLTYGLSTGLGFAGTVEVHTNGQGSDLLAGYRHALYLAIGLAGVPLVISLAILRVPANKQEGWEKSHEEQRSTLE
jgi:MFS family permease